MCESVMGKKTKWKRLLFTRSEQKYDVGKKVTKWRGKEGENLSNFLTYNFSAISIVVRNYLPLPPYLSANNLLLHNLLFLTEKLYNMRGKRISFVGKSGICYSES